MILTRRQLLKAAAFAAAAAALPTVPAPVPIARAEAVTVILEPIVTLDPVMRYSEISWILACGYAGVTGPGPRTWVYTPDEDGSLSPSLSVLGGGGEIRTHERSRVGGFQDRRP